MGLDASTPVEVLLQTPRATAILRTIGASELVAPDLATAEALSTLCRLVRQGLMTATRADEAVKDLVAAPLRRLPTLPLAAEMWRLCRNLSAYDACYVALAATLDCPLVSVDARLAGAPDLPARVIVLWVINGVSSVPLARAAVHRRARVIHRYSRSAP